MKNVSLYKQCTALLLIPVMALALTGCNSQTASQIFNAAATSVGQVLKVISPGWTGLAQYNALVAQATPLIAAGVTGTNGQKALQVVQDIASLLSTIPQIPPQYQVLIGIGLAGFNSVIALIEAAQNKGAASAVAPPTYKDAASFKKAWNAEVSKHPELATAKLN